MAVFTEKIRAWIKKPQNHFELVADIMCLAASYGLLFLMPQRVNLLFWTLFAISAFLFCIGFFRMGFILDEHRTARFKSISGALLVLSGIMLNIAGGFAICKTHGSERGIVIAILLLIEAIVMYSITASHADAPRSQWIMSLIVRAAAVLMWIGAVVFAVITSVSDTAIALGIMLIVEGIVLWAMGSGNNPFNSSISHICAVPGMNKTVQELCDALKGTETQLGHPWLGKIRTIKEDTIIYGPSDEDVFVYGYYHFGRFYVAYSNDISYLDEKQAASHRITENPDSKGECLGAEALPEAYANMIKQYLENGNIVWSTKLNKSKKNR